MKTQRAPGVPTCEDTSTRMVPAAVRLAKAADTVVLAIGVDKSMAAEGHDLKNLSVPDAQALLVEQVTSCFVCFISDVSHIMY